jgi:RNA 3'-terminal phosphate cyclase (ATP)
VIEIDGSAHSGSGTILRYAAVLATLAGQPLCVRRIRAKRDKPGLRPQHVLALKACCALSGGRLEGAEVGSQQVKYFPGPCLEGGAYEWDIGTAGSCTMVAFTLIPLALFARKPSQFSITGGLFQDNAPSAFHMKTVLFPLIRRMGGVLRLEILRPGYVPKGGGSLRVEVEPLQQPLRPLRMMEQGEVEAFQGISLSSHLEAERVSERMAKRCRELLARRGYSAELEILHDAAAPQKGAALLLWTETDTGGILGADQAGKPGRRSEAMAEFVVNSLLQDLQSGATCDRHLADQLILFAALAKGTTEYRIPMRTDHVESNLWLVGEMLGADAKLRGRDLRVEGVGLDPARIRPLGQV